MTETKRKVKPNAAQLQVINHASGPLLVVAGAGTGKTGVIIERINKLLDKGVEAKRILAVTFTEKAAAEMLERVLQFHQGFEVELPIMTFNAFGESLLREFNVDIGLSRNFLLIGDNAKIVFLKQQLEELELDYFSPISNPQGLLPDLADYFSRLKQQVITPEVYTAFVKTMPESDSSEQLEKAKHTELARAFTNYIRLSQERNVIDYDDQIYRVIELLEARPNIRKELQNRYHTVMIDEFQDTNPMQSRLIDMLVGSQKNLMVVGDDDQSIYGFRGATLANILQFKDRYPEAKEVTLTENYRSLQSILDASYKLIQHNNPDRLEATLGINKQLHAQKEGAKPQLCSFATLDSELRWIAEDIKTRLSAGENAGEIAILCRRNVTAGQISQALQLAGIEHVIIGEKYQLYRTEVVRMLIEALSCVVDSSADTSLYHTLSGALFNAPVDLLSELAATAKREHASLSTVINEVEDEKYAALKQANETIKGWRDEAGILSVGRLAYKIIDETGYKDMLSKNALVSNETANAVTQLSEFFKTLKEFESIALQPTALQYMESFAVLEAAGESGEDGTLQVSDDRVNVLTIHKAKGLEWETVYLPDCTEGSFPLRAQAGGIKIPEALVAKNVSAADEHISEERRLMYVALTRARTNLIVSYSVQHRSQTKRKPSRFITETFENQAPSEHTLNSLQTELNFGPPPETKSSKVSVPRSIYDGSTVHLSVSQITTFLNCPLDFYYRFVLNVPEPPSSAAEYGTAIHGIIEEFNKALLEGKGPSLEQLEATLESAWKPIGYISKKHEQRSKQQALETVRNFYKRHFVEEKTVPTEVESGFSVILQPEKVRIKGRFDAIFDGEQGVDIRDYKTSSSVTTPEKAKQRASGSDQLTLYALVWQQLHDKLPAKLSLEFVDTGMFGEIKKTQRGIDTMRLKIGETAELIKRNRFEPGKDHRYCRHPEL